MYVFCAKIFVLCIFGLISVLFFLLCCAKMAHILSKISFLEKKSAHRDTFYLHTRVFGQSFHCHCGACWEGC